MTSPLIEILACLAAYFAGSIPFGLLIGKLVFGIDIREKGSGNIGATNVSRTFGAKWGIICLVLDALKGLLPAWLIPLGVASTSAAASPELVGVLAGLSTIVGHMFPCWLKFKGGKGVATSLGVVLILGPIGSAAGFVAFVLCTAMFRIIALSSITAAVVFGASQLIVLRPDPFGESLPLALFSLAVPALIIVRHKGNIGRLWRGEEPKFTFGSAKKADTPPEAPPEDPSKVPPTDAAPSP
jgi:acyl phosphate:glycerol-3-phosphate acyltransferase